MAITNFIPEIWSAALLKALRDRLTYAQAGVVNRNYEGEIARAGDTVHITSFADPEVRPYTKYATITWDQLDDSQQSLLIDQSNYFAFTVDNIDKRQALPGFVEETTIGASYNLAAAADAFVGGLMVAGVADGTGGQPNNDLGAVTVSGSDPDAYELLVEFRTALTRSNTPTDGRFVVVPPEFYAVLLKDDRFIRYDASNTSSGLRNAVVGRAAGFDVVESNVVPEEDDVFDIVAGHSIATTYAEQIASVKPVDLQDSFGDGVKGLHLYGAKVIRPANLAKAQVTIG